MNHIWPIATAAMIALLNLAILSSRRIGWRTCEFWLSFALLGAAAWGGATL